ncbi:contractile injection system tape measure protein [Chitinophaga alhagiae]|uniref:contractile injection system tape measure protein n=1 Tax=Chitinophaga alhagiae TaxID=2203219 RepID=UPI000E5C4BAE|nr:contractile injection system tape measure protein [Chitinophaga alhagiae]
MHTHLIQKQTVEVTVNGTAPQAMELQRQVSLLCESALPAALERVLNLYGDDKSDIIIDYLTIDISSLRAGNFEEAFIPSVAAQLAAALQSRVRPKRSNTPAPAYDGDLIVYKRDAQSVIESRVELVFFHFLRTGVLLWWTSPDQAKSWEAAMLNLLSASHPVLDTLRITLLRHPAARQRFLFQFSSLWQQQVLALLAPTAFAATQYVQQLLQHLSPTRFTASKALFSRWQVNVLLAPEKPLTSLIKDALTQLGYTQLPELQALSLPALQQRVSLLPLPDNPPLNTVAKAVFQLLQQPPAEKPVDLQDIQPPATDEEDGHYIHNAGLILLMPFVPTFLRHCGAAGETGILHEGYAVALLEYLASGRQGVGEQEMIFNKILCGIPIGQPVEKITALAPEHMEEADNLLRTVISHWPVLQNTSPDGLRNSFLQRAGKLSAKDGNWLLQVEQQSYDEWLLAELPWSFQVVGVPYGKNKKIIWTEWM